MPFFHKVAEVGDVILSISLAFLCQGPGWGFQFGDVCSPFEMHIDFALYCPGCVTQQPRNYKRKVPGTSATVPASSHLAQGFLSHLL